ncbi:MAG: MarC family protein, partial [Rhodobacteraceae bacterium]|nr:MarC family protein [Paracoccaceae bacterium]
MLDVAVLAPAFVTMFVVIDPIGLSPLFIALTSGMDARQRRAIGLRACLIAAGLLTVFGLA